MPAIAATRWMTPRGRPEYRIDYIITSQDMRELAEAIKDERQTA